MAYPSIQQYQETLQYPAQAFTDPVLARGKIAVSGLGTPRVLCGGFALTYAVESGGKKYAVRCFHKEAKNLERRYDAISKKLRALASSYFLEFEYQRAGVRIGTGTFPVVKMVWATGQTLGEFVETNHGNPTKVKNLLDSLSKLSIFLEQAGIAHGDVQDLNIMVSDDGCRVQLIDYDGMYVPELVAMGSSELGQRDYQHPLRDDKKYDSSLDRFSFIALNLALRALCEKPSIWNSSQSGSGVTVFRANDFADPGRSAVLSEVLNIPELRRDAQNFASVCTSNFSGIPTLSQFLTGMNIPQATVQVHTRPAQSTAETLSYISSYPVLEATNFAAFERHIGQMVELVGKIIEVKVAYTQGGKPYVFINFGHWRGRTVKINLWNEALAKAGEKPSELWVGRWVTIRGLVEPIYANKKFNYEHISITADVVSQVSQITEIEARYRLVPPSTRPNRVASVLPDNAATLEKLRGNTPTNTTQSTRPSPAQISSSSQNKAVLAQMQSRHQGGVPTSPASVVHVGHSPQRAAPTAQRQYTPTPTPTPKSTGLWGWVTEFFK